uniref:Uncharacterized protein n=1 Tax=Arundo donax TaxID=35708 RepID=A0A0A9F9J8_ARUDO
MAASSPTAAASRCRVAPASCGSRRRPRRRGRGRSAR